jgi:hypothetical protein
MRRVFGLDVLRCRKCRTHRRLVALITERATLAGTLCSSRIIFRGLRSPGPTTSGSVCDSEFVERAEDRFAFATTPGTPRC